MQHENASWWKRRTSMEKTLTVVCTIGVLLSIGLLVGLIVVATSNNNGDSVDRCLSEACIVESANVLVRMNQNANPCDDFYEFACGTYLQETVIPDDRTQMTAFSDIEIKMRDQLRVIIEEPIQANEIAPFQNAKRLYQACLNTDLIDSLGTTPIQHFFDTLWGWPVVTPTWNENQWTWQSAIANSRTNGYGVSYLISFSVSIDSKDTSRRVIRIDQTGLGLSREYLIEGMTDPFVQAYYNYQVELAMALGATRAQAEPAMLDALNFEIALAGISLPREERRDAEKLYNPMTVQAIQTTYNYANHNWLAYFNGILPAQAQLSNTDTIIVGALDFFRDLDALLAATPKTVIANYISWRQAASSVSYLSSQLKQIQQDYERITTGRVVATARWLECIDLTLNYYAHAFGALYVRKHFKAEAKDRALEMVNNIQEEFKVILDEIDWMDAETRAGAIEKAERIRSFIGFADELLEDQPLVEYYNIVPVTVIETEFFRSIFNLNIASSERSYRRLPEPVNRDDWTSIVTPAIVNAYYSSIENAISFPAGILQGAFFNADRPQYMNYGGIGFVIGHEITHGFDDQGSQYDGFGNLRNWWANATRDAYLQKADCIIQQYTRYVEPLTNLNLNGINTQGENIADNGGIKESYRAYVKWAANNPEPQMPGLDYTPRQMFWISAGQVWCSTYREAAMRNRVTTGVHSPGQFRVIGPMSNMNEFASDFNCAVGTPMNPASKCEVW